MYQQMPMVFDAPAGKTIVMSVPIEGRWLTVTEAAEQKGLNPQQVRDLIKRGRIPATKVGSIWMLRQEDVDAFVWHGPGRPKKRRGRPRKIG